MSIIRVALTGSDVSEFQPLDTRPLGSDEFWWVRVSDGLKHIDHTYGPHAQMAHDRGIPFGPYLFDEPAQDPIAQADLVASRWQKGMLPPAVDIEHFTLPPQSLGHATQEFLARLAEKGHTACVVYMSLDKVNLVDWGAVPRLDMVTWWIASWGARPPATVHGRPVRFWQRADRGGAGGGDADVFLGSQGDLDALTRDFHPPAPPRAYGFEFVHGPWRLHFAATIARARMHGMREHHSRVIANPYGDGWVVVETYGPWNDRDYRDRQMKLLEANFKQHARPFSQPQ